MGCFMIVHRGFLCSGLSYEFSDFGSTAAKQLTNKCWHLFAPPSTSDFLGTVILNLALDLVTSCYGHKTVFWRPA